MEKDKGFLKENKQLLIIGTGFLIFIMVLVSFIVFVKKENARRKIFVKKVQDLYSNIIKQYNDAVENNRKVTYFSNIIYTSEVQNDTLKYCVVIGDNGGISSIEATDGRYYINTDKPDESSEIKWGTFNNFKCSNQLSTLALSGYDKQKKVRLNVFGSTIEEYKIEKIIFMPTNQLPDNVLGSFDASLRQDGSIMAWYTDDDNNNKYELYIGGDGGVSANEDSSYMFAGFYNLVSVDLKYLDTSNVTDMEGMFYKLSYITELDLSNFNTSRVKNMHGMFSFLVSIKELDLKSFNTSNVEDMSQMFAGCYSIKKLKINNFDTSNVTKMDSMFEGCSKLDELTIKKFDVSKATNMSFMFSGDYRLNVEKINGFTIPKIDKVDHMLCRVSISKDSKIFDKLNDKEIEKIINCE